MIPTIKPGRLSPRRHRRRRRRPSWSRPDRAMCGLVVNGSGTAAGFGGPAIGLIRRTCMRSGCPATGAGARMAGTKDRDIGGDLMLPPLRVPDANPLAAKERFAGFLACTLPELNEILRHGVAYPPAVLSSDDCHLPRFCADVISSPVGHAYCAGPGDRRPDLSQRQRPHRAELERGNPVARQRQHQPFRQIMGAAR